MFSCFGYCCASSFLFRSTLICRRIEAIYHRGKFASPRTVFTPCLFWFSSAIGVPLRFRFVRLLMCQIPPRGTRQHITNPFSTTIAVGKPSSATNAVLQLDTYFFQNKTQVRSENSTTVVDISQDAMKFDIRVSNWVFAQETNSLEVGIKLITKRAPREPKKSPKRAQGAKSPRFQRAHETQCLSTKYSIIVTKHHACRQNQKNVIFCRQAWCFVTSLSLFVDRHGVS